MSHTTDNDYTKRGIAFTIISWLANIFKDTIGSITFEQIPIILSCVASSLAIINLLLQIKKNRK